MSESPAQRFPFSAEHTNLYDALSYAREAEAALRESELRWRALFERMTDGFFIGEIIWDNGNAPVDFRFIETNSAFDQITGLTSAAGKTVRQTIPGIQAELIETYARVASTGEPANFEVCVPALEDHWYDVRARPAEPGRFAALFVDITKRKRAELRLLESEARQAALVELGDQLRDLKDVKSLTSAAMKIVGTALRVARAGYGRVDTTQQFVTVESDWTDGSVGTLAGTYRFRDFGSELGNRLQRGEWIAVPDVASDPVTCEEKERWEALDVRAVINVPLVEQGRLAAILFIQDSHPRKWTDSELTFVRKVADRTWAAAERAHAVRELQESEEFTRSVLSSSPDSIKVMDLEGRLLSMNEGACRQMGIEDASVCLNQRWVEFWAESDDAAEEAFAEAKAGRTARFEGFCRSTTGGLQCWEVVVTPIRDASGKPVRILSLSRDITERQRAEQERERLTRELKRSNEELSHFAHIVAHDLQSPLRGVLSFAQLLQRRAQTSLPADHNELLNHIVESARRMQDLVEALLRFAQVGQGDLEKKQVSMNELTDAALQSLQLQVLEDNATITREELPAVFGDPVQLVQVLQNLIGNALKYRRPDVAPQIRVYATRGALETVIAIEDNGEGIAPEHRQSIFEPLSRLHGAELPGSGLGLAMCDRIIGRHGGRIWVESQLGAGSTFHFALPNRT